MTTSYSNPFDDRFGWACQLLIDCLLLLTFIIAALPETLLPPTSVSGLQFCMFAYFPAAALLLLRWFGSWTNTRLPLMVLAFGGIWMAVVGFFSIKDVLANKSFGGDLIMYSGVICGFVWAEKLDVASVIRRLRIWTVVTLGLIFVTVVALQIGALTSLGGENRVFVYSLYWGSWLLTCLAPVVIATAEIDSGRFSAPPGLWRAIGFACLACAFLVGFISATRSVVIGVIASLLLVVFLERKRLNPTLKILVGILGLIGLIYFGANAVNWFTGSELSVRFQSKGVDEETRMIELMEMREAMMETEHGAAFWYGQGFGGVFYSTGVGVAANVLNPHVAVLTLLFKGGIPIFLLCTVVPCAACILRLFRRGCGSIQRAACAGGLLYFVLASLSGGWDFKNLFLFGACYALACGKSWSPSPSPISELEGSASLTLAKTA